MTLSNKLIEKLIKEKEYEYLKELLEEFFSDNNRRNRLFFNVYKTLEHLEVIENSEFYNLPNVKYNNDRNECLKRFGEALIHKDFTEAYNLINDCKEFLTKHNQSTHEMYIYKILLEDVISIQNKKVELCNAKTIINNSIKSLRQISQDNKDFNIVLIPELKTHINTIIDYSYECNMDCIQFIYMLEIIDTIDLVKNNSCIDKSYFSNLKNEYSNFYEILANGDYVRSYEYMLNRRNREKLILNTQSLNIKIIFKLLKLLDNILYQNKYENKKMSEKIEELLLFDENEKALELYLKSDLKKDEEVISKMLILNKYSR